MFRKRGSYCLANTRRRLGSNLIVRRGSEPALTKLITDDSEPIRPDFYPQKSCIKRWSAIASIDENKSSRESEADDEHESDTPPPTVERVGGIGQEEEQNSRNSSFSTFSRGSSRRSLANNAAMLKWLEAQELAQEQYQVKLGRCEPLGGHADEEVSTDTQSGTAQGKQSQLVILKSSPGALGIHVIPELDPNGRERGLLIQSVEEGGRIHRDGRIKQNDVITEINGTNLAGVDFAKAQEIFRQALHADELHLRIVKAPPPLPEQSPSTNQPLSPTSADKSNVPSAAAQTSEIKQTETNTREPSPNKPPVSPPKGPPPPVPARNPNTTLTSSRFVATNTRKIGKKIHIQLTKGPQGLGFSVTTRDNPTGGHAPIYIKKILPKGAAIEDGNLKPGDRLLEVNGIEMTGKSQTEAVTVLRNTKMGSVVNIVVSRQVMEDDESKTDDDCTSVQKRSSSSSSASRVRPASTLGFRTAEHECKPQLSLSKSNQDLLDTDNKWLKEWDKSDDFIDDEKSPVDDVDPATVFRREGFGRQSMSEKRKGHIDPRMIEFYQKIKSSKESGSSQFISASWDPRRSAFQQIEVNNDKIGPVLGLKKSSSLESLQVAVQEEENNSNGSKKVKRGRGCNESFRAAVDRSYEQTGEAMETVEEEGSDVGSVAPEARSRASSVSGQDTEKHGKKTKKEKEKGIFKGFFKLGKSKKSDSKTKSTEELREKSSSSHQHQSDSHHHTTTEKQQNQQILDHHQQQREEQARKEQLPFHRPSSPPGPTPASRADKLQQLRLEHQRRHRERHGHYPLDAEEERHIEELERQRNALRNAGEISHYGNYPLPPRQQYDERMKYERARLAYADTDHYSHYQNVQEIQAQLREHEYYQHRYHQAPSADYVPGHYAREVNVPPPPSAERRYGQRPYGDIMAAHDPRNDVYHYGGYYAPHHPAYRTATPSPAPHLPMSANQSVYLPHPTLGKPTPQINLHPPAQDYPRQRVYSEYDLDRRNAYNDPPYGSLSRRREHREMPGSAQV